MSKLVIVRHGQSEWNAQNRFTGWVDVELAPKGVEEARAAGEKLKGYRFDKDDILGLQFSYADKQSSSGIGPKKTI